MTEEALFAAGCFWGVEAAFRRLPGVVETAVGYAGGTTPDPTYEQVCAGGTGHAETVRVRYDPARTSYADLVREFFRLHDPTQKDRQGPDVGPQYRSALFPLGPEQAATARAVRQAEVDAGHHAAPVATTIENPGPFHPAEDYHQQYLEKRGYR